MLPTRKGRESADRWSKFAALLVLAALAGVSTWSYAQDGIAASLLRTDLPARAKLDLLRVRFQDLGAAAPLAYIGFVTVEVVVAPIPGTILYAPGGAIFGGFFGGLYATIGNVLGAGLACQLMRTFGRRVFARWLEAEALVRCASVLERRGLWIVFLLRVNPFTSSDLVSYAAGLTNVPVWKVMSGTLLGMAPLCFAQSYLAEGLLDAAPSLFYPLLGMCAIYAVVVVRVLCRSIATAPAENGAVS